MKATVCGSLAVMVSLLGCSSGSPDSYRQVERQRVQAQPPDLFWPVTDQGASATRRMSEIRREPGIVAVMPVFVDVSILAADEVRLAVAPGKILRARRVGVEQRGIDDYSWFGSIQDVDGHAIFVVKDGEVTGTISTVEGVYGVRPIGDGVHALTTLDPADMPPEHSNKYKSGALSEGPQQFDLPPPDASPVVELIVAYTPSVLAQRPDALQLVQLAVDEANAANVNSGVTLTFHLAHAYETNYVESSAFSTDLVRFQTPNDGYMDEVHSLRDWYHADVAVLLINNSSYCGLASTILASADSAFAAVYYSCATGYYSFAHEIGHLMGTRHNMQVDSTLTPFAYGHGYQYLGSGAHWRTIMAYDCSPSCPRLQYWSNPNVSYSGSATGTAQYEDNHRVLNGTATSVSHFRDRVLSGIVAGGLTSCAVVSGGARCWGWNNHGQLGNGSTTDSSVPVQVAGLTSGVQAISVGLYHACAIVNGGAWCWGNNGAGQLGDRTTSERHAPVQVAGLTSGVQAIAAGDSHSCAIVNGGVWCWGEDYYGQLGNNSSTNSSVPVQVVGLTSGVQAIAAAGGYHTCAIVNGSAQCWGYNYYGELGDGTTTERHVPVQVSGLTSGVQAISASGYHSTCAIVYGGAKCWGANWHGELGDGTITNSAFPVQVSGLTSGVQAVVAGSYHTCAIVNGSAKCWGYNYDGEVGDGTTTERDVPVQVVGLTSNVQAIAAGNGHSCAIVNGGATCWGYNYEGQLGNGTTAASSVPVVVSGL